jgi:hypothetical protein
MNAGSLSVAAIADLHAGGPNMLVEHVSGVVDAGNALRPDLAVRRLHRHPPVRPSASRRWR